MQKKTIKRTELVPISQSLDGFDDFFEGEQRDDDRIVWAEPQLYLLPFCVPQDRTAERFRQIRISETINIAGEMKHRSFIVTPHPDLGLPGSFELEVMTGIYRVADIHIKQNGSLPEFLDIGTFRSFLETIGRPGTGKYIKMLKEALRRLAGTTCISEGFFYSKPRNLYVIENFSFITSLQIAGESDFSGATFERTRVRLHEFIRENLSSNFRTIIDFDALRELKTGIAKPLSLHIAYRIFKNKRSEWIADYDWLAERLAIKVYEDLKASRKQLKPALIELQKSGFIQEWQWTGKKIKFLAGPRLTEMHKRRVNAKDAWLAFQQEQTRTEKLITAHKPRTIVEAARQEAFDPLATICTEFAVRGWSAVADKAKARGLTVDVLAREATERGHTIRESETT